MVLIRDEEVVGLCMVVELCMVVVLKQIVVVFKVGVEVVVGIEEESTTVLTPWDMVMVTVGLLPSAALMLKG